MMHNLISNADQPVYIRTLYSSRAYMNMWMNTWGNRRDLRGEVSPRDMEESNHGNDTMPFMSFEHSGFRACMTSDLFAR